MGTTVDGSAISARTYKAASAGDTVLKVKYTTSDTQANHVMCKVGALTADDKVTSGCLAASGTVTLGLTSVPYSYTYNVDTGNSNGRTIAGFSTSAPTKMLAECPGCPYKEYKKFYDYYGVADYAHQYATAAFDGTATNFTNGNADFSTYTMTGRTECAKKGTAYMNVYMYVIRELEDALDDCVTTAGLNAGPMHAWDEGVAFYTGSLQGTAVGGTGGKLIYTLANKRCGNYKTCGAAGDSLTGNSFVNEELFKLFTSGLAELDAGKCSDARKTVDSIVDLMSVPLVQGAMRYAYKVEKLGGGEKEAAEGAVFAAAVLPRVHACSAADATTIYDNTKVGATSIDHAAVKAAFENNYACMGITGGQIGGLWDKSTGDYYPGAGPLSTGVYCLDSPFRFMDTKANKSRSCKWVGNVRDEIWKRCNNVPGARLHCPVTCGTCFLGDSCKDGTAEWRFFNNYKWKTCDWVAKNKAKRCDRHQGVKSTCPVTCGMC